MLLDSTALSNKALCMRMDGQAVHTSHFTHLPYSMRCRRTRASRPAVRSRSTSLSISTGYSQDLRSDDAHKKGLRSDDAHKKGLLIQRTLLCWSPAAHHTQHRA